MRDKVPNCRQAVIEALELLSSADKQRAYERNVPKISVTDELICLWFDDVYLPEEGTFRSCFSLEELAVMAAFSEYYDKNEKLLPKPQEGVTGWLRNETWQGIMREAAKALLVLQPHSF